MKNRISSKHMEMPSHLIHPLLGKSSESALLFFNAKLKERIDWESQPSRAALSSGSHSQAKSHSLKVMRFGEQNGAYSHPAFFFLKKKK